MIRFACPGCLQTYALASAKAGQSAKCTKCRTLYKVPPAEARTLPPPKPPRYLGKR